MKMEKMRLLDLKLDEKNNFVFDAEYGNKPYVFDMYYETKCNIRNVLRKSIIEAFNTSKKTYKKSDINNYVAKMMISNFNGVSLPDYCAKLIKEALIDYLKFADIIIDEKNTFYAVILTAFIDTMFNDFAVDTLRRLVLELVDYNKTVIKM